VCHSEQWKMPLQGSLKVSYHHPGNKYLLFCLRCLVPHVSVTLCKRSQGGRNLFKILSLNAQWLLVYKSTNQIIEKKGLKSLVTGDKVFWS